MAAGIFVGDVISQIEKTRHPHQIPGMILIGCRVKESSKPPVQAGESGTGVVPKFGGIGLEYVGNNAIEIGRQPDQVTGSVQTCHLD